MSTELLRIGTIYIPVYDVEQSSNWYEENLEAEISYKEHEKAIANFANQSFFLVKANQDQSANFYDVHNVERFSITFEVNGLSALKELHQVFSERGIKLEEIEDRGHSGKNFIFYDLDGNKFDVWSELSPIFKDKYGIE